MACKFCRPLRGGLARLNASYFSHAIIESMEKAVLEPLVQQGLSLRVIARSLGTSPTNARHWIRKFGLNLKQKPFGPDYIHPQAPHRCWQCGEINPTKFYGHKRKICGPCQNAYNIKQGQDKRLRAVKELGGRCYVCGFSQYPCSLDFHHWDPTTKDPNFRSLRGWSWKRILIELEKCTLLCKNCHAAVHNGFLKI